VILEIIATIESAGKVKRLGSKIKLRKTGMLRNLNL
jgi:hypothetical protein